MERELPEGSLNRFFVSRLGTEPVRVANAFQIKDVLPARENPLMERWIGERSRRQVPEAAQRQFGLKGFLFRLAQGTLLVVSISEIRKKRQVFATYLFIFLLFLSDIFSFFF
jgi:hypothetical protein